MSQTARRLFIVLFLMCVSVPTAFSQTTKQIPAKQYSRQTGSLTEEFSFLIKDFKVEHQDEHNVLNISVWFRYVPNVTVADYPDYRAVAKDVETFLTNYPNEQDYWEIVNKGLTAMLLKKYPSLAMITCEITVDPVERSPYTRSSRVTRARGAQAKR
ncbi:MAG TPA: hypothetical protein VI306_17750 [Pyrinomonadaceae bacterium]